MNPNPLVSPENEEGIDLPFDPETDLFWFYVIEAEVKGCEAEFYLNDIAVAMNRPEAGHYHAQPVNHLVIDGENELSFIVKPGPYPSMALTGPPQGKSEEEHEPGGGQSVTVHLSRYPFGAVVGGPDREVLQSLAWPLEIHEEPHEYPLRMATTFTRATGTGPWVWQSSDEITLDEATRNEINAFLNGLWASLEAKDPEPFLDAAAPRFDELATAFEDPPYKKRNAFRKLAAEITTMQPLEPDSFDLRLAARGRLVECLQKDWGPILRGAPDKDGNEDQYDMFLGRLDGTWKIIR
jgi:hypothetical protein